MLSIWHAQLRHAHGEVTIEDNLRDTSNFYKNVPGKSLWRKRAESFDRAVATAAQSGLAVRAIICDGEMRAKFDLKARASHVHARMLDKAPWAVVRYERQNGRFILRRGASPNRLKDQFSVDPFPSAPTETRSVSGEVLSAQRLSEAKR